MAHERHKWKIPMVDKEQTIPLRHILLCVAGLTPQIIMETLYALTQERGERVDEIRVITTTEGRDKIMTGIANGRGRPEESLLHHEKGQFYAFCRDYNIPPQSIKFDETSLYLLTNRETGVPSPRDADEDRLKDILTDDDNERAANQICEIVRELAQDEHLRIHASVAGGRKTMGIYLTAAMQLFGRVQDKMSHVLVTENFERSSLYYLPPQPQPLFDRQGKPITDDAGQQVTTAGEKIYLAVIPFILLLSDLPNARSYNEMVQQAQDDLDLLESEYDLEIDLRQAEIRIGKRTLTASTPREFLFYAMFAEFRQQGRGMNGFVPLTELTPDDLDRMLRRITAADGDEYGLEFVEQNVSQGAPGEYNFLIDLMVMRHGRAGIDHVKLSKAMTDANSRLRGDFKKHRIPERYRLVSGRRGTMSYGIDIESHRIKFI